MRSFVVLLSILVVGFLLRVTSLGSAPLGLQADEASFLFNTAAILETGRDEDNQRGALFLTSLIDPKPALYSYLQLPFVAAFGPTTFASRLPSALLGVVSLYLAYLLVMRVTGRRSWGLGMAAVLALSPWHIMNSRATQEVMLSLVLVQLILLQMLALGNWWQSRERLTCKSLPYQKLAWFFLWVVLAMYTYHAAKVLLVVFFTLSAGVAWMQQRDTRQAIKSGVVLLLVGAAFILTLASALTRFSAIGLASYDLPKAQIFQFTTQATGKTPLLVLRALYNKPVFYGRLFYKQYLSHFSPTFYFTDGGATKRFLVPEHGLFYAFEAVLMVLGLYYLLSEPKLKKLVPYWCIFLLASPLAAALTTEELPSSIRAFYLVLPLSFLVVLGGVWLARQERFVAYGAATAVVALYAWNVLYFSEQFFVQMPLTKPLYRSRHYEKVAEYLKDEAGTYQTIHFTDDLREMYIYLWREQLLTIETVQAQPLARYQERYTLGKFSFNQNHCDAAEADTDSLVVSATECDQVFDTIGLRKIESITFDDGTPAFNIYTR